MFTKGKFTQILKNNLAIFTPKRLATILLGTAILSFGLYNVHSPSGVTEGGVLGLVLLLNHWLGLPASIASPVLDVLCYALAFKILGKDFLKVSLAASLSLAGFLRLWEQFPPLLPPLPGLPAALLGGVCVGLGVGLVVRQGGSCGGDDALALTISKLTKMRLSRAYLFTDVTVLLLSLSYIPFSRIAWSLLTVTISSFLIDGIKSFGAKKQKAPA